MSYQPNPNPNFNPENRLPQQSVSNQPPVSNTYHQPQANYQSPGQLSYTPPPQSYFNQYSQPAVPLTSSTFNAWTFMVIAVGGLLMAVATFLPWYQYQSISVNGLGQTSGFNGGYSSGAVGLGGLTLIPGVLLIVFGGVGALTRTRELASLSTLICVQFLILVGFVVILVGSLAVNQYAGSSGSVYSGSSSSAAYNSSSNLLFNIGFGVYLGILGAILGMAGGVWSMVQHRSHS